MPLIVSNITLSDKQLTLPSGYAKILYIKARALPGNQSTYSLKYWVGLFADKAAYLGGAEPIAKREYAVVGSGTTTIDTLYTHLSNQFPNLTVTED